MSLLLFSIVAQTAFLVTLPAKYRLIDNSDYFAFYGPVAQNIAEGHGLLIDGKLPARYPPGFPAFLAPQFYLADHLGLSRTSVMKVFNVFVAAFSCLVVLWLAEMAFSERVALISAYVWAIYPFNLWLVKQPNSEVPFIAIFLLAVWCYLRGLSSRNWSKFVLAGLLLGVAALIRPIALFVPFILAAILILYRRCQIHQRLVLGGLLVASFLITLAPWEIALKAYTGHFAPLSTGGPPSIEDGLIFPTKAGNTRGHAWVPPRAEQLAYGIRQEGASLHTIRGIAAVLSSESRSEPVPVIELGLLKVARSWYGAEGMHHEGPILVIQCFYLLWIVPGVRLAWRRFADKRFLLSVLVAMVLYFWGMTILVLSILRYMVPVMPFLLMFAAASLDLALGRWFTRSPQSISGTMSWLVHTTDASNQSCRVS